jgi:hypothetical protein
MATLALILQAIAAIPKILTMLQSLWGSIRKMQQDNLSRDVQKAISDGDTKKAEELIGSPTAGKPSNLDGVIMRPKKPN